MTNQEINNMLSEMFERLRLQETDYAVLKEKMDTMNDAFKEHDKKEMAKFDKVTAEIANFKKIGYILIGVLIATSDKLTMLIQFLKGA